MSIPKPLIDMASNCAGSNDYVLSCQHRHVYCYGISLEVAYCYFCSSSSRLSNILTVITMVIAKNYFYKIYIVLLHCSL